MRVRKLSWLSGSGGDSALVGYINGYPVVVISKREDGFKHPYLRDVGLPMCEDKRKSKHKTLELAKKGAQRAFDNFVLSCMV